MKHLLVVPSSQIAGREIKQHLGLVRGNTIRARHLGKDILAVFRNIVGGEIHEYTKLMAESREQAIDRMIDEAKTLGADAIIDVRFTTSMVAQSAAEILVFGTAVVLKPKTDVE
jgi:uncharacterized protein YbjQ (UPF0145 family)